MADAGGGQGGPAGGAATRTRHFALESSGQQVLLRANDAAVPDQFQATIAFTQSMKQ